MIYVKENIKMMYDTSMGKQILKALLVIFFVMFILDYIVQIF